LITATYRYYVDWDGDNSFTLPGEDISAFVFEATWEYGRDYASQLNGRSKAGSCRLSLDNSDSRFSPFNVSSPIYGQMLPGRRVRVTMQIGNGSEVTMWQGFLESITPTVGPMVKVSTAELLAYGSLAHRSLQGQVSVPMHTDIKTGDAITEVLDQAQFPAGERVIDAGQGTMSRWWDQGTAIQALRDLEETEAGFLRETKDGKIAFEDRAHRLSGPHTVSQATFGGGSLVLWNPQQNDSSKGIFNHLEAAVRSFDVSEEMVLWTLAGTPPAIAPGATLSIKGQFPNPTSQSGYLAVSEWTITDYQANSQADGGGSDLTEHVDAVATKSAIEILLEFTNNGTETAYLTLCRCHGVAVIESDPVKVWAEDDESKERFGYLPFTNVGKFLTNIAEAQDRCDHFLAIYKDPVPIVSFDLKANYDAAHLAEAQVRDVSDRITITAGAPYGLYIDEDFFVEWIRHNVGRDKLHVMTLLCSSVVSHHWPASGTPYEPKVIPPPTTGGSPHVPDDLWTNAIASGLRLAIGAVADKWNVDIDEAEMRAKLFAEGFSETSVDLRTPAEGGTLVHNGTDAWVVTGLAAGKFGIAKRVKVETPGRLYFAFRLHNTKGWSVWTDGNDTPEVVLDYLDTEDPDAADTGPPEDWAVEVIKGSSPNSCRIVASRPKVNGHKILFGVFQIRDSTVGQWRGIAEDSGVAGGAEVWHDGSAQAHIFDPVNFTITIGPGGPADYGADVIANGGLLLMDVRCGQFHHDWVIWNGLAPSQVNGNVLRGCGVEPDVGNPDQNGLYQDVRIMIVKPPWTWTGEGHQGNQPGMGEWGGEYWKNGGDKDTQTFESEDILYDPAVSFEDLQGRVWFGNALCFSDDDTYSACPKDPGDPTDPGVIIVKWSSHIVIDCNLGSIFYLLLTADAILDPLVNAKHCKPIILIVQQDGVGGHRLTLDDIYNTGIDIDDVALSGEPDGRDYFGFMHNADYEETDVVAFVRGY